MRLIGPVATNETNATNETGATNMTCSFCYPVALGEGHVLTLALSVSSWSPGLLSRSSEV
jgi:predicted nucleotide-binding protein (sugar kinase/HSP70/actin superfamily)